MNGTQIEITADQLRDQLRLGVLDFSYKKTDGTLREARGTKNLDEIPEDKHPIGGTSPGDSVITYFDLDKGAWRSVSVTTNIYM